MKKLLILLLLILASCNFKNKDEAIAVDTIIPEVISIEKEYKAADIIEFNLLDIVLKNLNLTKEMCKMDLVVLKLNPNNPQETIIVIPEIAEEGEQYFALNSHIVAVNSETGKITHKYFESSKTNGWVSDAIELREIKIDTAPYKISEKDRAFGVRVSYRGSSRINPYVTETISLFLKTKTHTMQKIATNYEVNLFRGEWDTDCEGEFNGEKKTLHISAKKTNGYYDILVNNKVTETTNFIDEKGDCEATEEASTIKTILQFNGKEYIENAL